MRSGLWGNGSWCDDDQFVGGGLGNTGGACGDDWGCGGGGGIGDNWECGGCCGGRGYNDDWVVCGSWWCCRERNKCTILTILFVFMYEKYIPGIQKSKTGHIFSLTLS